MTTTLVLTERITREDRGSDGNYLLYGSSCAQISEETEYVKKVVIIIIIIMQLYLLVLFSNPQQKKLSTYYPSKHLIWKIKSLLSFKLSSIILVIHTQTQEILFCLK